jgi:hypothetical protein
MLMIKREVRESTGKGEVKPRRLDLSFLDDIAELIAYNRGTLHSFGYLYHVSTSPQFRVDPKYQVRLSIRSSFLKFRGLDSLPGTASVGPSSLSIHL